MNKQKKNFLIDIVDSLKTVVALTKESYIGVKNTSLEHIYISPALLKIFNVTLTDNKKISVFPKYSLESTYQDDQEIIKNKISKNFLIFCQIDESLVPLVFVKTPIFHPDDQAVLGIMYQGFRYDYFNIQQHITSLFSSIDNKKESILDIHLSKRQKQVIFFFMLHLDSQEIANQLSKIDHKSIKKSTIDSIFNLQLYPKFHVTSRAALYQKMLKLGYNTAIPRSLISPSVLKGDLFSVI